MSVVIEIPLTRGKIAVIDEADLPIVQPFTWYATKEVRGVCYANTWRGVNEVPQTIRMHRLLMAAEAGQVVDHINGDGLDNRRENLRFADARRNQWNRRTWVETSSYKGVRWYRRDQVWYALITTNGKKVHLGSFPRMR